MKLELRPMTRAEQKYSYTQSQQIAGQTGCIGHLRADMDMDGNGFFSSWDNHRGDLKTQEFKDEFDEVLNALRFDEQYGGILKNRSALAAYCNQHPESAIAGDHRSFGFRADTEQYSYLLRVNPHKGEYNLYCYCYRRDRLDDHMKRAEKGIRFITPDYKEKFRIPDGDKIRITTKSGETRERIARYIDDYHMELSGGYSNSLTTSASLQSNWKNINARVLSLCVPLCPNCVTGLCWTPEKSSFISVAKPATTKRIFPIPARRRPGSLWTNRTPWAV